MQLDSQTIDNNKFPKMDQVTFQHVSHRCFFVVSDIYQKRSCIFILSRISWTEKKTNISFTYLFVQVNAL